MIFHAIQFVLNTFFLELTINNTKNSQSHSFYFWFVLETVIDKTYISYQNPSYPISPKIKKFLHILNNSQKELPNDILNVVQLHWTSPILNAFVDVVQGGRSVKMRAVGVNKGDCMFD